MASKFNEAGTVYYACDPEFGPPLPKKPKGDDADSARARSSFLHDVNTLARNVCPPTGDWSNERLSKHEAERERQRDVRYNYVKRLVRAAERAGRSHHNYAAIHPLDGSLHIFADVDGTAPRAEGMEYVPLSPDEALERLRDVFVVGRVENRPTGSIARKKNNPNPNPNPWTMANPFRNDPDDEDYYLENWPDDETKDQALAEVSRRLSDLYARPIDVTQPSGEVPYTRTELNTHIRTVRREHGLSTRDEGKDGTDNND